MLVSRDAYLGVRLYMMKPSVMSLFSYKCFESAIEIFRSPQATAMAQPGEPSPTYHNAQSRGAILPIITLVLTSISFIMVMLRGYLRIYILRRSGLDDLFIGLALVSFLFVRMARRIC